MLMKKILKIILLLIALGLIVWLVISFRDAEPAMNPEEETEETQEENVIQPYLGSVGTVFIREPDVVFLTNPGSVFVGEGSTLVDPNELEKITKEEYDQAVDTSEVLELQLENELVVFDDTCFYILLGNGEQKPFCEPEPGSYSEKFTYGGYSPLLNSHLVIYFIEETASFFVNGSNGERSFVRNFDFKTIIRDGSIFVVSARDDYAGGHSEGGIAVDRYSFAGFDRHVRFFGGVWGVTDFKVTQDDQLYFEIEAFFREGGPGQRPFPSERFYFKQPLNF